MLDVIDFKRVPGDLPHARGKLLRYDVHIRIRRPNIGKFIIRMIEPVSSTVILIERSV